MNWLRFEAILTGVLGGLKPPEPRLDEFIALAECSGVSIGEKAGAFAIAASMCLPWKYRSTQRIEGVFMWVLMCCYNDTVRADHSVADNSVVRNSLRQQLQRLSPMLTPRQLSELNQRIVYVEQTLYTYLHRQRNGMLTN